jgi:uncharacterized membrane protein
MKALLVGLIVIAAAVFAVLPMGLGWQDQVLAFLKGSLPVIALLIGLLAIFIGIADLKDRIGQKKEDGSN